MKKIVPNYYEKFNCIADKCNHSCCVGWEIDIDPDTMKKYNSITGDFGLRLKNSINTNSGVPCFELDENEKCPFLNDKGLCDIIINIGEEGLSQICSDHPRFRNFFSDREELGLGLCCEEACRLILSNEEKTELVTVNDCSDIQLNDDENIILSFREKLFAVAQNRDFTIFERMTGILEMLDVELSSDLMKECISSFLDMEILDENWIDLINNLKADYLNEAVCNEFETAFEQLLVYFIYRHVSASACVSDIAVRGAFAVLSVKIISCIFNIQRDVSVMDGFSLLCDICRMYSSEIEYCEENTEKILDLISDYNM